MKLIVAPDYAGICEKAANIFADEIRRNPACVLGLAVIRMEHLISPMSKPSIWMNTAGLRVTTLRATAGSCRKICLTM